MKLDGQIRPPNYAFILSSVTEFGLDGCQNDWVERKCP